MTPHLVIDNQPAAFARMSDSGAYVRVEIASNLLTTTSDDYDWALLTQEEARNLARYIRMALRDMAVMKA